jgi:hypothetical protein
LEFVEIFNPGPAPENLTDWKLTGAVNYTFPSETLFPAGSVLVVLPFDPLLATNANTLTAFRAHYGIGPNIPLLGPYVGALANEGETLRLRRPDEPPAEEPTFVPMLLEDEVSYLPTSPWPTIAAGGGASLRRRGPNDWGNDPQSWSAGTVDFASPGRAPNADLDGDGLPDSYEIETYGSTNMVHATGGTDTDADGSSDANEYIAGTSATNTNSRFEISASVLPDGTVLIQFETHAINGPGYFGVERFYTLEQTTNVANPASWSAIPGYAKLPAATSLVTSTNLLTNTVWSARGRVWLE